MEVVTINRAPVLTLWASVVAERLGFDPEEALTLGKAVAGLTAQSKGQRLGIFTPSPEAVRKERAKKAKAAGVLRVALLGRTVPVLRTDFGLRAVDKDQKPMAPTSVDKYLRSKFGDSLPEIRAVMEKLARSKGAEALAKEAFQLYEAFRPEIPEGESGWGAKGKLNLKKIQELTASSRPA
jgi:hypothetical protein